MEEKKLTKEELIKKLKKLQDSADTEFAHIAADEALIYYINDQDIKREYELIGKWYA